MGHHHIARIGNGSWPLQARLDGGSAGADGNVNFGWSVALSGDRLAAGEPGRASTLQSPPPVQAPDGFGVGTAFAGDDAVIGAPGYGNGGSVFVAPMGDVIFADGFEEP